MGFLKPKGKPLTVVARGPAGPLASLLRPRLAGRTAPCLGACLCGGEARSWIGWVAGRERMGLSLDEALTRAWRDLVDENPLPATLGRICPHPCEAECNRAPKDGAVAVNALERFVGDWGIARGLPLPGHPDAVPAGLDLGVVGAGPAGLSFAWQAARRGHAVTVYDALPEPGGALVSTLPPFRLPRPVVRAEVARIRDAGVRFASGVRVGRDVSLADLQARHAAVFVAVGAWKGRRLGVPDVPGVFNALEVLGAPTSFPGLRGPVVVVGAGGTGLDVARTVRRLGLEVTVLERVATEADAGAPAHEVAEARAEGVILRYGAGFRGVDAADDGTLLVHTEAGDASAATVVLAVAQDVDWTGLDGLGPVVPTGQPVEVAPNLWVGGDAAGAGLAAVAIRQGRLAAEAVHARFLGRPDPVRPVAGPPAHPRLDLYDPRERAPAPTLPVPERFVHPGAEPALALPEEAFLAEISRCLSCGQCYGCERCWMFCTPGCFSRSPAPAPGSFFTLKEALCDGCGKCAEACPCDALEMR